MLKGICVEIRNGSKSARKHIEKILVQERANITNSPHGGKCIIIDLEECSGCPRRCGKDGPLVMIEDSCGVQIGTYISAGMSKENIVEAVLLVSDWLHSTQYAEKEVRDDTILLSRREKEIAISLMHGKSNKLIARDLGITETTVKVHVRAVLRKTKTQNRTQIAIWAKSHLEGASI